MISRIFSGAVRCLKRETALWQVKVTKKHEPVWNTREPTGRPLQCGSFWISQMCTLSYNLIQLHWPSSLRPLSQMWHLQVCDSKERNCSSWVVQSDLLHGIKVGRLMCCFVPQCWKGCRVSTRSDSDWRGSHQSRLHSPPWLLMLYFSEQWDENTVV